MQITLEKNIPLPRRSGGPGKKAIYPFATMSVGDSFSLPLSGDTDARGYDKMALRLSNAANGHRLRHGGEFTVRTLRDEGVVRCWRVA